MNYDPSDVREPTAPAVEMPPMPPCPRCGSPATLPILWGYPGPGLMATMDDKIVFGGCCVPIDADGGVPNIECSACGQRWQVAATENEADPDG